MNEDKATWAAGLTGGNPLADVIAAGKKLAAKRSGNGKAKATVPSMHVGRGIRYGNLTWFPIWTDAEVVARDYVTTSAAGVVSVVEGANPSVGVVEVENKGSRPVLLLEGDLLEGGWQHRALTRTLLVEANSKTELPVVCVERGRWGGATTQVLGVKRAPAGVRRAIRGIQKSDNGTMRQAFADQGEVWQQVNAFSVRNNKAMPTESLVEVKRELEAELAALKLDTPEALYGQRGVLVAIGGVPLAFELFDHPDTLAERLVSILEAYLPESLAKPYVECRSQIARDFVARVGYLGVEPTEIEGRLRNKADKYVAAEAVMRGESLLHMSALNAAHELVLVA